MNDTEDVWTGTCGNCYKPLSKNGKRRATVPGSATDQNHTHIHNVRPGQARFEQVACGFKEGIGVVALQVVGGRQSSLSGPSEDGFVGEGAGRVGGTVLAIGAAAEHNDVGQP